LIENNGNYICEEQKNSKLDAFLIDSASFKDAYCGCANT
jgi:hypothetical protein